MSQGKAEIFQACILKGCPIWLNLKKSSYCNLRKLGKVFHNEKIGEKESNLCNKKK